MRKKPKSLTYISIVLSLIAVGLPLQIMFLYGNTLFEPMAVVSKLAPLNWVVMGLAPVLAWLVYRASIGALVLAPVLALAVLQNNLLVANYSDDFGIILPALSTAAFFTMLTLLYVGKTRELLLHPNRRWWLTPRRKRATLSVHVQLPNGKLSRFSTFDISKGGAFLTPTAMAPDAADSLCTGTRCIIQFTLRGYSRLACIGEVVRNIGPNGQYPAGVGLRFVGMTHTQRKQLEQYCASL